MIKLEEATVKHYHIFVKQNASKQGNISYNPNISSRSMSIPPTDLPAGGVVAGLPAFKPRCCQSYMDGDQCRRCPFRQIENESERKTAMNEAACNALIGGVIRYNNLIIPYYKTD